MLPSTNVEIDAARAASTRRVSSSICLTGAMMCTPGASIHG